MVLLSVYLLAGMAIPDHHQAGCSVLVHLPHQAAVVLVYTHHQAATTKHTVYTHHQAQDAVYTLVWLYIAHESFAFFQIGSWSHKNGRKITF